MQRPKSKAEIIKKRAEIENKLNEYIKLLKLNISFEEITEIIYHEKDQGDLQKIIAKFDQGQDIDKLNEILEIVNDTWNYFPHKSLNGLSPMEKILETNN